MHLRLFSSSLILFSIVLAIGCGRAGRRSGETAKKDKIDLDQTVTTPTKPQDVIFSDFAKNWRKFVNQTPEIMLPVVPLRAEQAKQAWEPVVLSECVFSQDAGGLVPQVTLIWNEPVQVTHPEPAGQQAQPEQKSQQTVQQQKVGPPPSPNASPEASRTPGGTTSEVAGTRFDLAVHAQGFERNFYSSALSVDKQKRFTLPANSALVSQEDAVLLTGPALFPKLADYRVETVRDRDTNRELGKQTLVLTDLSPGLSYTIRVSTRSGNQWTEQKEFVFLTPVCNKGL
jgi:hypothetical protein